MLSLSLSLSPDDDVCCCISSGFDFDTTAFDFDFDRDRTFFSTTALAATLWLWPSPPLSVFRQEKIATMQAIHEIPTTTPPAPIAMRTFVFDDNDDFSGACSCPGSGCSTSIVVVASVVCDNNADVA